VTQCILVEVYVGMGAFASILSSLFNICTLTRLYGLTPETTGSIVTTLRTSHTSHVLILTAHYAWSTDVWVRFINKY
jgi:hypothetical protein